MLFYLFERIDIALNNYLDPTEYAKVIWKL